MKRKDSIKYVDGKVITCEISYRFTTKEIPAGLRALANDLEEHKVTEWSIYEDGAWAVYDRPATPEEINKFDKQAANLAKQDLENLRVRAKAVGYKLVKE